MHSAAGGRCRWGERMDEASGADVVGGFGRGASDGAGGGRCRFDDIDGCCRLMEGRTIGGRLPLAVLI
jgi:hypothetical protein